jgi:cell division septum initiation protein DivIVA
MSQKSNQDLQQMIEALTKRVASLESQVKALQQLASRAIQTANRSGVRR